MVIGIKLEGNDNVFGLDSFSIVVENGSVEFVVAVGFFIKEIHSESLNGGGFC